MPKVDYNISVGDLLKTALAVVENRIDQGLPIEYNILPSELASGKTCKIITFKVYLYETTNEEVMVEPHNEEEI